MATETRFKIYTKTGDSGTASLYNGERRPKEDQAFAALGDVDELNSALGVAREFCGGEHGDLAQQLATLQSRLLDVGSAVATPLDQSTERKRAQARFEPEATDALEAWIDAMDEDLPQLRNFILPSGGRAAAFLHLARSVCRRAERSVVPLVRGGAVDAAVGCFLNRLSDYLFQAARWAALKEGKEETTYKKGAA
ncbi:MAG: Adenosylcobalamin biosynthesis, ATP:cob(I)alamin adenosyltransferase-like protein [Monoraphidium minutum]|nr:MAG: Adenosylcobalamin biosynthesis, ATP:cob(I)alamin adenosyltransferase-like protein [Monoraphidium minutum]